MSITWQNLLTATLVVLALGYVLLRVIRVLRHKGLPGCGCCRGCTPSEKPLVNLEEPPGESSE